MNYRTSYQRVHQQTLSDILFRTRARYPDKLAVVYREERLTYRQWSNRVTAFAQFLLDEGFVPGNHVAIYAKNSLDYATLLFAMALSGLVSVPINFMLGPQEVAYILEHAEISGLVGDPEFVPVLDEAVRTLSSSQQNTLSRHSYLMGQSDTSTPAAWRLLEFRDLDPSRVFPSVDDADLAQILYTSGTESRPKGVMLTHWNLISEYTSAIIDGGFSPHDVVLHALPFYHSAQQNVFLGPYTYLGATHVITDHPHPDILLPLIQAEHVTEFFAPPTVWINLLRSPQFDQYDLSSLIKGHYGAASMPREIIQELSRRLPHTQLWNFYGQTEVAPLATVLGPLDQLRKLGSAGKASLNVETVILNDDGDPVPPGTLGEICHRTPHAMVGYFRDPEKTAEAFQHEWFHSGDLGVMDDEGYMTVIDRKKDMIKTGGENVASREVEEILYQMPDIAEAAVIGMPDSYWIEQVVAVVVLRPGTTTTETAIQMYCRDHLAPYKCPKSIKFVSELPKNPSGKILKRQLRDLMAQL